MTSTLLVVSEMVLPLLNGTPTSSIASLRPKPEITSPLLLNWAALSISRRLPMPENVTLAAVGSSYTPPPARTSAPLPDNASREDAAAEQRQGAVVEDIAGELAPVDDQRAAVADGRRAGGAALGDDERAAGEDGRRDVIAEAAVRADDLQAAGGNRSKRWRCRNRR